MDDLRVRTRRNSGKCGRRKFDNNMTTIIGGGSYTSVRVSDDRGDSCGFLVSDFERRSGVERRSIK